eukprot:gene15561-21013_t
MSRKIVAGTSPNENKEIAIFEAKSDGSFKCYTKSLKYFTMTAEQKKEYRKMPRSAPFMFIQKNIKDPELKLLSIRKQCKKITNEAKKLLKLTDGKMNLYRTGSVAKTSLQLWYDLSKPKTADKIEEYEVDILESCRGPFIWAIPYKGRAYKYDIVSEYPSIMNSNQYKFPIGKGTLKIFTNKEFDELTFYGFGIYHVKVQDADYRVFRENSDNWYTHSDLNFAKSKLKLNITLIEDGQPNALLYDSSKLITAKVLFGEFVDYLFKFKKDGHKEVKKYINCLWGALVETNTLKLVVTDVIYDNSQILKMMPTNDGKLEFEFVKKNVYYNLDYARIKPFLLSYGRLKIANIVLTNLDNVVRVHTDGIITKTEITNVELGSKLGDLKYENFGKVDIKNSNTYTFTEK